MYYFLEILDNVMNKLVTLNKLQYSIHIIVFIKHFDIV